jgi:hypothetical protein
VTVGFEREAELLDGAFARFESFAAVAVKIMIRALHVRFCFFKRSDGGVDFRMMLASALGGGKRQREADGEGEEF